MLTDRWARMVQLYRRPESGYAYRLYPYEQRELDKLMDELKPGPFDLLPAYGKVPSWASEDYDKPSRVLSGWDYNCGDSSH